MGNGGWRGSARWVAGFSGRTMEVRLDMFERPGARLAKAVEGGFGEIAGFVGARGLSFA